MELRMITKIRSLLLVLCLVGCAHQGMKSGRYVEILPGDNLKTLAKEFQIPEDLLASSNPGVEFRAGDWVFIPDDSGILTSLIKKVGDRGWFTSDFPQVASSAKLIWPVPASSRISSSYGMRRRHFHEGIDIPAHRGTSILSAGNGKVIYSGRSIKGYGNLTIISHENGYFTVYGHAQKNLTQVGDKVTQGQVIAHVGSTGRSTGPHLHFEVRHYDRSIDPMHFLDLPAGAQVASSSQQDKDTDEVEF